MNGVHDLGGMHGFGPVRAESETTEPLFHHPWEADVLTSMFGTMRLGKWSLDEFRFTIEHGPALDYLRRTYYEKWLAALETLVVQLGLLQVLELADRGAVQSPAAVRPTASPPTPSTMAVEDRSWVPSFDLPGTPPRFAPGQAVRARNRHPSGHTRQPRYVRGRAGTIVRHVGAEPLPELAATGVCRPEHVYLVRFEAAELWGEDTTANNAVLIELWDSYLEPRS